MLECSNNSNKYSCIKCNKIYKNRSGLWYHNNKIHATNLNTNGIHTLENSIQNVYIETTNIICKYCNKKLFNRQSRWRHEKTCINKNSLEKQNELYKETIDALIKERPKIKNLRFLIFAPTIQIF
jgi:hypothetical protein